MKKNTSMKNVKWILVGMLLVFLCSCKTIIMNIAGLRTPKIETKSSVFKFLQKLKQDTNDVYALDTVLYEKLRHESFKPSMSESFRPVQIRVYNYSGKPVMQWASCEGFLKDLKTFNSVPPKNHNNLNESINLTEDLARYYTLDGFPAKIIVPPGYDFYILIYFAKFFPRLSKESFSQVEKYKAKHPELRMKIYKINVDVQKFWDIELNMDLDIHRGGSKK